CAAGPVPQGPCLGADGLPPGSGQRPLPHDPGAGPVSPGPTCGGAGDLEPGGAAQPGQPERSASRPRVPGDGPPSDRRQGGGANGAGSARRSDEEAARQHGRRGPGLPGRGRGPACSLIGIHGGQTGPFRGSPARGAPAGKPPCVQCCGNRRKTIMRDVTLEQEELPEGRIATAEEAHAEKADALDEEWPEDRPPEENMGALSSQVAASILAFVRLHANERKLGKVFGADCGYQMPLDAEKKTRFPDGSFIARGRLPDD